jgi:putative flippase GtrA
MTAPARPLPSPRRARLAVQFARFVLVGASNTALSLAVYVVADGAGAPSVLAGALGFAAGAVNGFVLNGRWTFRTRGSKLRYLAVQLAGLGATAGLLALLGGGLGAYVVTIPIVTVGTFAGNRAWAFA